MRAEDGMEQQRGQGGGRGQGRRVGGRRSSGRHRLRLWALDTLERWRWSSCSVQVRATARRVMVESWAKGERVWVWRHREGGEQGGRRTGEVAVRWKGSEGREGGASVARVQLYTKHGQPGHAAWATVQVGGRERCETSDDDAWLGVLQVLLVLLLCCCCGWMCVVCSPASLQHPLTHHTRHHDQPTLHISSSASTRITRPAATAAVHSILLGQSAHHVPATAACTLLALALAQLQVSSIPALLRC